MSPAVARKILRIMKQLPPHQRKQLEKEAWGEIAASLDQTEYADFFELVGTLTYCVPDLKTDGATELIFRTGMYLLANGPLET